MNEILEDYLERLHKIQATLKKNPYRNFSRNSLEEKLQKSNKIFNAIDDILLANEDNFSETELNTYIKTSRTLHNFISVNINSRLTTYNINIKFKSLVLSIIFCNVLNKKHSKTKILLRTKYSLRIIALDIIFINRLLKLRTTKMALQNSNMEIIKIITSLIPCYDGNADKLKSIIDALKALEGLITEQNKIISLAVIKSRFEGKARAAIGENPESIQVIIDRLHQRCDKLPEPDTILAKINNLKQTGDVNKFTDTMEKLSIELENAYISNNIPVETATKMSTKAAVKGLINGIKNHEVKTILKAGQFTTLSSAIEKIVENDNGLPTAPILNINRQNHRNLRQNQNFQHTGNRSYNFGNRYNNFQNFRNRNNNFRNFENRNNNSHHFVNHNNFRYRQNSNMNQGYNNRRQQENLRTNQNFNRGPGGPRMYYTSPENHQVPQQITTGGRIINPQQLTTVQHSQQQTIPMHQITQNNVTR